MLLLSRIGAILALLCFCLHPSQASTIAARQNGVKIMIVGDSISHGSEGAYTWRYRLWQWLRANNVAFNFVGPWTGTFQSPDALPPQPPLLQGQPEPAIPDSVLGGYALDVDPAFDKHHFTHSGRQAAQMKNTIAAQVATYQPDYMLIELGFNDLGWWINGPEGLLADMKTLIDNARRVKGNIKFAVANVPYRTRIQGRQDLIDNTDRYNAMLDAAIPGWSTISSPIKLVRFRENYNCGLDSCPAAFDGLHPNQLGEYQIAQAFSRVLNSAYGFGSSALDVPGNLPARGCPAPTNVRATPASYGVAVTWDKVYGSHGYRIKSKRSTFGDWTETFYNILPNRYNQIWAVEGETWSYQIRTDCGDASKSDWSPVVSAKVHLSTAPGPKNVVINPANGGFSARWDPPDGGYNVQMYEVFTYDIDEPCVFMLSRGIRGNSITVSGLPNGHRHVVVVSTWTDQGPGFPAVPFSVMPGAGTPSPPQNVKAETKDGTTVKLTWTGAVGAANFRAWVRNVNNSTDVSHADNSVVRERCLEIWYMFPGVWNYEICVTGLNGNLESGKSTCVMPSRDASPGWSGCPPEPQFDCGWGEPGKGGDGTGQPGQPGGGSGGGGGGGGGSGGDGGDVYIDPGIWKVSNPHVTCSPPCNFILPPKILPTPTTITLPPYTTDLEVVWTSNGKITRTHTTTTVILPPIITQTISFWQQSFPPGPAFTFSPVPRINPPPTTIRNKQNPEVVRTITPSPYPTKKAENDNDDRKYGGPFPPVTIDVGPPGPICSGGCGSPCQGGSCNIKGPCIPLLTCPRGGGGSDSGYQDPADPDKTNDPEDEDDDDDDDDDGPEETCPFPQPNYPAVNPRPLNPGENPDIVRGTYPGPKDAPQAPKAPTPTTRAPTPTPTPTQGPPPTTNRFWVFYVHYIDEILDNYEWQFFSHRDNSGDWSLCDSLNAVNCPASECRRAPNGELTKPPMPNGSYTANRGDANGCVYSSDGQGAGSLQCPNQPKRECRSAADTGPKRIDCGGFIFAMNFYAAVYCDW